MLTENLPAIQVLIPLVAAPICALLPGRKSAWAFALIATLATFICSMEIIRQVYVNGTMLYAMGGWAAPFGIEYSIDILSAMFLVLISGIGSFCIIYSLYSAGKEIEDSKQPFFYTLYLLCLAGLLGIVSTNDIFNIYVFLEISSLAAYALVAMGKDRRALIASFEYLILGTVGATFILIAIGLVYAMTGTLNITDISLRIQPVISAMPVKMAIAFFTVGLALKIAMFPMHLWLTNAYTNAPSFVSSFLCATSAKVGIYIFIRLIFSILGVDFSFEVLPIGKILIILGALGMLIGAVVAVMQDNLKRMLAYSSVSQIGFIILGIGLANEQGLSASLISIISHAIAKSAMFMAAGAILYSVKGIRLSHLKGIGRRMPVTMGVFIISGLSLVGVPGTAGFIGKWYLLQATITAGMWPVFAIILITSLITFMYIWRVVEIAFFNYIDSSKGSVNEAPVMMLVPMVLLAALSIVIGIWPVYINGYVDMVATVLFGG